jgi:hypothetical protein
MPISLHHNRIVVKGASSRNTFYQNLSSFQPQSCTSGPDPSSRRTGRRGLLQLPKDLLDILQRRVLHLSISHRKPELTQAGGQPGCTEISSAASPRAPIGWYLLRSRDQPTPKEPLRLPGILYTLRLRHRAKSKCVLPTITSYRRKKFCGSLIHEGERSVFERGLLSVDSSVELAVDSWVGAFDYLLGGDGVVIVRVWS